MLNQKALVTLRENLGHVVRAAAKDGIGPDQMRAALDEVLINYVDFMPRYTLGDMLREREERAHKQKTATT